MPRFLAAARLGKLQLVAMGGGAARRAAAAALAVAVAVLAGVASAAVYEVGDKAGWTVMGNPNYAAWASSKKFHVNDVVGASRSIPPSLPVSLSGELAHEASTLCSLASLILFSPSESLLGRVPLEENREISKLTTTNTLLVACAAEMANEFPCEKKSLPLRSSAAECCSSCACTVQASETWL